MAEAKTESKAPIPQKYIAKEDCFFKGRFLKRGEIILLDSKPDGYNELEARAFELDG